MYHESRSDVTNQEWKGVTEQQWCNGVASQDITNFLWIYKKVQSTDNFCTL